MTDLSRRGILGAIICAPAIVRASSLMAIKPIRLLEPIVPWPWEKPKWSSAKFVPHGGLVYGVNYIALVEYPLDPNCVIL